jgi:uncharacterized lipoprotein YajG
MTLGEDMKKIALLAAITILAGCGSFPLGMAYAPPGVPKAQLEMDVLVCQDRAKNEANTNERQVGNFLAGMTIIGAPIAMEAEKAKQREVFKVCMENRGYRVEPPVEARK